MVKICSRFETQTEESLHCCSTLHKFTNPWKFEIRRWSTSSHDRVKAQPPLTKYSQNFVINTVQTLLKCRLGVGSSRTFRGYFRCIDTEFRLYFRGVILLHRGRPEQPRTGRSPKVAVTRKAQTSLNCKEQTATSPLCIKTFKTSTTQRLSQ